MILANNQNSQTDSQAGVTLMLAVLVLAAITAVAFSLATIVFIEIRSAGDSSRTEPALYGTFGVTEEALFQYKRTFDPIGGQVLNVPACAPSGSSYNICSLNGVTLSMPGTQPIAFDSSPRVEFIGKGVTKVIPMYVVNDYTTQQYQTLKIDVLPNGSSVGVNVDVKVYSATSVDPTTVYSGTANPGSTLTYSGFSPGGQYELTLTSRSVSQDVSVGISTVRVGGAQPDGLPYVGEQVLRIMASYVGLTRTYQVRIPIP
ncbi:MAG TPA: hypothetical protein VHQ41_00065 [Patescibacteria group bacterium]|jgi:hypothetical protein|nr:hypothetical protein [Patescibacteria group bacterium]